MQQQQPSQSPQQHHIPKAEVKPVQTSPSDYDQLLKSIEEMKQRHELDKVAVDQLTASRPPPKKQPAY